MFYSYLGGLRRACLQPPNRRFCQRTAALTERRPIGRVWLANLSVTRAQSTMLVATESRRS